jgi:DNA-binding transcriptional ArsR family regulator
MFNHMVECAVQALDDVFRALADGTRRDLLARLMQGEQRVTDLAAPCEMSLAAVSKHLGVLERARLISRRRAGRQRFCRIERAGLESASAWLSAYRTLWAGSFDVLEAVLDEGRPERERESGQDG